MPFHVHANDKDSVSTSSMRSKMESKQSSRQQQNTETKPKIKTYEPHSSLPSELKRETDGIVLVRPKSSRNHHSRCDRTKTTKDDELVKYMSNLPGYLQRLEGEENLQDKAFNVGVLDWTRLQRWKYDHKYTQPRGCNNVSSTRSTLSFKTTSHSSTFSHAAQGKSHAHQSEQQSSRCPGAISSHRDAFSRGTKPSREKVLHFQDLETSSNTTLCEERKAPKTYDSFGRNHSGLAIEKGKMKYKNQKLASKTGDLLTNFKSYEVALSTRDREAKKRVEETQESKIFKRALDQKNTSELEVSYPKLRTYGVSLGSKEKTSANNAETKEQTEKLQKSNIDLGHQHLPGKRENIVVLLPRERSRRSSLNESKGPQTENLVRANMNKLPQGFPSDKVCPRELCFDIPYTCPLPSKLEPTLKSGLVVDSHINNQNTELSSDKSHMPPHSGKTSNVFQEGKVEEHKTIEHETAELENLKILDQEMAEETARRGRHPSPNRRFSFSLGRLGRSFSLKESSTSSPISSTYGNVKSGPLKSEDASWFDELNREKVNGSTRSRSSPFRRLLGPLRRSKGSNTVHCPETVQPLTGSWSRASSVSAGESLQNENCIASTTQALLQLTIKNGIPLFKFVVENSSSVLAATVKNLTSSAKGDSVQNYTFYSVKEVKKKSGGWMTQASKVKSCDYAYNVVGQMKVSSSQLENQYAAKESVLFGVDLGETDQTSPGFMPSKELGAVVVKIPIESLSPDTEQKNKEWFPGVGNSFNLGEIGYSHSTTVIFPGGLHSLPNKGAPSPLIERWKSGGSCDCGGWDVGCKLKILSNHNGSAKSTQKMNTGRNYDPFELFIQGEGKQNKPVFSLVPLNGEIYSVEFNSSISLLQAFFVCVTVLSGQKPSDLSEAIKLYDVKGPSVVTGERPAKYAAPIPPSSPVGRV